MSTDDARPTHSLINESRIECEDLCRLHHRAKDTKSDGCVETTHKNCEKEPVESVSLSLLAAEVAALLLFNS